MEQVEDKFVSMIFQTEIERIKYLLKSYLRARLFKVRKGNIKKKKRHNCTNAAKRLRNTHFIFYVNQI